MNYRDPVSDEDIAKNLTKFGWHNHCVGEGRLMLLELISKAGARYYNSHTEEQFLCSFNLLKKDRTPNRMGLSFIKSMVYASSNKRPRCFELMQKHRA